MQKDKIKWVVAVRISLSKNIGTMLIKYTYTKYYRNVNLGSKAKVKHYGIAYLLLKKRIKEKLDLSSRYNINLGIHD